MLKEMIESLNSMYIEVSGEEEEKIVKLFKSEIMYEPTTANEFLYMGLYYQKILKNSASASNYYKQAAELGSVTAIHNLGNRCMARGDMEQAKECYKRAINFGHIVSFYGMGQVYQKYGKQEKAKECYIKGSDYGDPDCNVELGNIYRHDDEKSLCYYKRAYEVDKTIGIGEICNIYNKQNKYEEALIFAYENKSHIKMSFLVNCLNRLRYPVSDENKNKIYSMLEEIKLPDDMMIKSQVFRILQEVMGRKVKVMCDIAYTYRKYNNL